MVDRQIKCILLQLNGVRARNFPAVLVLREPTAMLAIRSPKKLCLIVSHFTERDESILISVDRIRDLEPLLLDAYYEGNQEDGENHAPVARRVSQLIGSGE
jgi:hypothetical protein